MYNLHINKFIYTKMKSLNECFVQIRENLHFTQSEFAKKIGVSRSTIAKIENNEIEVSKKNIFNLWQNYPEQVEKYELLRKEIPKQHSYMNTLEVKKQVDVLISIYRKNIEDIEYFNNKIKSTVSMLKIFDTDLSDYNTLLDLLNANLIELKETYNAYLVYSLLEVLLLVQPKEMICNA